MMVNVANSQKSGKSQKKMHGNACGNALHYVISV